MLRHEEPIKILNDENIKQIAKELTNIFKNYTTTDWKEKTSVKSRIRVEIKKLLKQYNWPSTEIEKTTDNVCNEAFSIYEDDNYDLINDIFS